MFSNEIKLSEIIVENRFRKDYGDIEALANSIKEIGLLQPIGIDTANRLVFGERRLKAFQLLGIETIPVRVVSLDSIILGEYAENEFRKDFTPSERVAIGEAIEAELGNRQGKRTDLELRENFPEVSEGRNRDIAAKASGFGNGKTYEQAKKVVEQGAPELVEAMDTGKVSINAASTIATVPIEEQQEIIAKGEKEILQAAKQIRESKALERKAQLQELKENAPPLPDGKYECIVIDPPWEMQKIERDIRPNQVAFDYPTMSEEELTHFDIQSIAADNSHLFCWTTHKHLPMALRLIEKWGFRYVCTMVWHKSGGFQPIGLPQYNCEFILYARKGTPSFIETKAFPCCFEAPRREHSRKPEEFYQLIKRVTSQPRIDIFSRETKDGFDSYGNEQNKFDEAM